MDFIRSYSSVEAYQFDGTAESAQKIHQRWQFDTIAVGERGTILIVKTSLRLAVVEPGQWVAKTILEDTFRVWSDADFRVIHTPYPKSDT